jgi:hypothetical protein
MVTVAEVTLRSSTGDPAMERIVRGVIGVLGEVFADRVRGYYLRGSYATGTSTAYSDLDMFVVFGGRATREEAERAGALCAACALLSPVQLEVVVVSENQLRRPANRALALQLKLRTRLLHGEDIRADLPAWSRDAYVRSVVDAPCFSYAYPVQRRDPAAMTYPLGHIDPDATFYGFDQWPVPDPDDREVPSTKLLVASVCWTATALIALHTGVYVGDKGEAVARYRQHVADEWTDLVTSVYERCRNRWGYRIPAGEVERRELRAMCKRALAFQNHFLEHYREYLLAEVRSGEPDRQELAARRLGQMRFPDAEVRGALRELVTGGRPEVGRAATATLDSYPAGR